MASIMFSINEGYNIYRNWDAALVGQWNKKKLVFSTKSIQSIYRLKMEENLTFLTQTFSQSKIFDGG